MRQFLSLFVAVFLAVCTPVCAQDDWKVADVPDSLKRDAHSVIRTYELTVNAPSEKSLTMHYHVVVTILSKKGEDHASWHCYTSNFHALTSFSGKVYDEQGKVIRKLKRSDVHASQYSENLASDTKLNYVEPPVVDYPYTIEYDWEMKSTDGYMEYGMLSPIRHSRQALQNADFQLTVPSGTQVRYIGMPQKREAQKQTLGKNDQYVWHMSAMRGLIDDDYEDQPLYFLPMVMAIPQTFRFGGSAGTLDSWESLGRWYSQLAEGRGELLPADVQKVKELTADCKTDREKIEALYGYLAEKTRYVSIQLGIGGWQPMSAMEVGKTCFGDCKALTNYMQALLREVGIESHQTIISTEYSDLIEGFPNMHQTDHVILTVPQPDGSNLVVECTNPQLPLGFISSNYAGHEALQVTKDGGRLIRIDGYTPANNYEVLKADVQLNTDGTSVVAFACDHYGAQYGRMRNMAQESEGELKKIVGKWIHCKDPVVTAVSATECLDSVPHLDVKSCIDVTYGEVHGNKIFLPCNPFRSFSVPRFRAGRQRPIVQEKNYGLVDEISVQLPEGYFYKPNKLDEGTLVTDFGNCEFSVKQEGRVLNITTEVNFNRGRFDISRKDDFVAFYETISKMMKRVLIVEKM